MPDYVKDADAPAGDMLVQITAPDFCAGIVLESGCCIEAAPVLGWCVGKSRDEISRYVVRKLWKAKVVSWEAGRSFTR